MTGPGRSGVLLLGFGGPDSLEAVEPFMTQLMGRAPSPELLERIRRRYLTIGGRSPLPGIADDIARGLQARLSEDGFDVPVRPGMRYWHPYIADSMRELAEMGVTRIVTVNLSPFDAPVTSGAYRAAVDSALAELPGVEVVEAHPYRADTTFIEILAFACASGLETLPKGASRLIVFTAHSLPVDEAGDEYVSQLREAAGRVAERLQLEPGVDGAEPVPGVRGFGAGGENPWILAYQSKGARGGEWLGPDVEEVLDAAHAADVAALGVCPIAFLTDHMETLYDLDVVLAGAALERDMEFSRSPVPNDHDTMIEVLAKSVRPVL